uniref:Uncharacterized protein n=1 Tax=Ananas comosus var. bracteatus TaxID=296719 RepID=A0A6V7PVP1_ANACO|nr:unnamed protein product [Ananas comosus var. bracteatus]
MESVKLDYRRRIFGYDSENYHVRGEIMELENRARGLYSENVTMEREDFAKMLLLDGCFIAVALGKMEGRAVENIPSEADLSQHEALNRHDIVHDLLLVENQIPFFVLEKIHNLAGPIGETTEQFKKNIAKYVEHVLRHYPKAIEIPTICSEGFHHLLHLCHMFFRPSQKPVEHHCIQTMIQCFPCCDHSHQITNQWHRARQYREAGVKFRVKGSSTPHSLLDVTFSNGTMKIPHLSIDAKTESIFSNLIVFERGYPRAGNYINAYVTFMSQLLGTADDVELLVQKGIIDVTGGRYEEASNLFGRLNGLAVFDPHGEDYYLKSMLQSVEAHYLRRRNWWMAWLKHNHLTNPCVIIAALLGFISLLCIMIQNFLSILKHFNVVHH